MEPGPLSPDSETMRDFALIAALVTACVAHAQTYAQNAAAPFTREAELYRVFGDLPKRGSLSDILACAGANEVLWTTAMRQNPRDPEAHEAKRKAGWYSAVALQVFAVDSQAVVEAVNEATDRKPRPAVLDLARRCRTAPDTWRE